MESISEALVDSCEKGTNLKKFKRAIEYTKELGIKLHLTFMFGIPEETEETIDETLAFAMDIAPESAQFSLCTPFPGTKFYRQCEENGWLTTNDWSHFLGSDEAVVSTPWLSAERLQFKYQEAQSKWHEFNLKRLREKQDALLINLQHLVEAGKDWTLLGERDFADFIWKDKPTVVERYKESVQPGEVTTPVIISKHNEEKIFRRLKRTENVLADQCIRLFN